MKKLILASLTVAIAAGIQAATVKWTGGNIYEMGSTSTKATGYLVYFISTADYARDSAIADLGNAKTDFVSTHGQASKTTTSGMANNTITTTAGNGESWSGYLVIFNASTIGDATHAYVTATDTRATGDNGQTASLSFTANTGTQTASNWYSLSSTPVPEPTTVALLALGLAAVGLKRKLA